MTTAFTTRRNKRQHVRTYPTISLVTLNSDFLGYSNTSEMTPETMRAYRMLDWQRPPELVEVDVPRPEPGEVRIRVAANGIYGSDLAMMAMPESIGVSRGWRMPFTLGHEITGWVDELGYGVESVAVGDLVALIAPASCGACSFCLSGQEVAARTNSPDGGTDGTAASRSM